MKGPNGTKELRVWVDEKTREDFRIACLKDGGKSMKEVVEKFMKNFIKEGKKIK